jgi:signal transduction histidine kinase/ActR/RegA family two-component response regulator
VNQTPRNSLRRKVVLVVLSTTGVALLLSATALLIYELRSYQASWIGDLQTQADIIARASGPALAFNDRKAATENLAMLRLRPHIIAAAVYRANGELFARYPAAPQAEPEIPPRARNAGHAVNEDQLELFQPIRENNQVLGTVYLRARFDILGRLIDYAAILAAVMLSSLIVAALVTARLQRAVTMPILDVAQVARRVMQSRDFSLRAPKTSDDEVGALVDAFNDMLAEVGRRTDALEQSNAHLSIEMAQRRKAEQALTAAARTKDEFLATLAHELRNPLAPISNAVELLRRPAPLDGAVQQRALQILARQVQQMVRLIDDLLDVSRITTGKLLLHKGRVDLCAVLQSAIEIATPSIEGRGHRLEFALPARPVELECDAMRLAQVFANLLNNAAKYTDPGGRIALTMQTDERGVTVRVSDSGIGIPPEMQGRIFDMFVQADPSHERGKSGLGVGLTLARQLIALHGGRIAVASAGLGQGSEFSVWLPTGQPAATSQPVAADSGAPQSARRRILVADDNVDFATSLCSILESMGHVVTVVHDGPSALAAAPAVRPDFIFLDIGMPGLDGYELARGLRTLDLTRNSVLVAITGWGQEKDRVKAREAGFDHHLVKPVDVVQLAKILGTAVAPSDRAA